MAFDYSQVANPCGLAVSGAYLVSLCAHLAGKPDDGVRDSLSAGSLVENDTQSMTEHPDFVPFGRSSPISRETSVSCLLVTTVQARVHITFPVPFTSATFPFLAHGIGTDSRQPCVLAHRSFNHSSEPPDYSRRTYGQGHAVSDVVWWKTRHRERWRSQISTLVTTEVVTRCNKSFSPENMSLFGNEKRALGAHFPVSHTLEV